MHTVRIGETDYPIHFGMSVIKNFCKSQGIDLPEFQDVMAGINFASPGIKDVETFTALVHAAFMRGAEKAGQKFTLSTDDLIDAIDEQPDYLTKVMQVFFDQMAKKKTTEQQTAANA